MSDVAHVAEAPPVDTRDELRAVHRHRQQVQQHHEHAMAAERRGRALLSDAEHELAEIEHQEAVEATQAAERLAAAITAGAAHADAPRAAGRMA
jgi:hypothetical protein